MARGRSLALRFKSTLEATRRTGWAVLVAGPLVLIALADGRATACVGDCRDTGHVSIADLVMGVNIVLGAADVSDCPALATRDGTVDVAQLVAAVNNALTGCADRRFVDNSDGTITDKQTGLMWEKKVGLGGGLDLSNPHAADNTYPWAGACELAGDYCQLDAAAAAACMQAVQGDSSSCATCPGTDLGIGDACRIAAPDGETTIWGWVSQLNAANFAGYADWRIPTLQELETIIDYSAVNPAVDHAFNGTQCGAACTDITNPACSCTQFEVYLGLFGGSFGPYWSATTLILPYGGFLWWYAMFDRGETHYGGLYLFLPESAYVRAVRGAYPTPMPRFVDNGDETVTDHQTGLMWEKKVGRGTGPDPSNLHAADNNYFWTGQCSAATGGGGNFVPCQPTAAAAAACARAPHADPGACSDLDPCSLCHPDEGSCVDNLLDGHTAMTIWDWIVQLNAARLAGYTDWRLPTEPELQTLVDYEAVDPAVDAVFGEPACTVGLPGTCGFYWSVTDTADCSLGAWFISFDDGEARAFGKLAALRVRAVRRASN